MSAATGAEATARDYIEGWLSGDADRIRGAMHPRLAKRRVVDPSGGSLELADVSYDEMVADAASGRGRSVSREVEIRVLETTETTASVRVTSAPFVDHLQLGRFGDRWLIVNCLYERR
ncbi:MAG: nuclear transport factor 2 family protein [Chloroflexi bacterium]|nr:nuclear transport factor 2 family protein [Chloroflexota bacterium]